MRLDHDSNYGNRTGLLSGLVVIATSLILGACAAEAPTEILKPLGGNPNDPKEQAVIGNMRTLRLAVNAYHYKHENSYPLQIDDELKSCLPKLNGGDGALINPYTSKPEWPVLGAVKDIQAEKGTPPEDMPPGAIEYSPIAEGKDFAIRGGGTNGKAIHSEAGEKNTLVLTSEDAP
jgi:hypothetical protein